MPNGVGPGKVLAVLRERGKGRYRNEKQQHHGSSSQYAAWGEIPVHRLTSRLRSVLHEVRGNLAPKVGVEFDPRFFLTLE